MSKTEEVDIISFAVNEDGDRLSNANTDEVGMDHKLD